MIHDPEKYILVHSGRRDGFKVAEALYESKQLGYLVSDDYIFRYYLKKQRNIPINLVKTSLRSLFWLMLYKSFHLQTFQVFKDQALSKKAASLANKMDYSLLAYSYYALPAFEIVRSSLTKVLFQLHPQPTFIRSLYEEEIKLIPAAGKSLRQEHELRTNSLHFKRLTQEALNADIILCASTFTKFTLQQESFNVPIHVIPYGVNLNNFAFFDRKNKATRTLRVLFVGSLNQRKGIYYLLKAVEEIQKRNYDIELTIIGRGIVDQDILALFSIKNLIFKYNVRFSELILSYNEADVFVLPSICEGFGQVILESMATGLPVISTNHTSAPDLITDGVDGFIIPIRESNELVEKLLYLIENPIERLEMGNAAFMKAKLFTWERFKMQLISRLND